MVAKLSRKTIKLRRLLFDYPGRAFRAIRKSIGVEALRASLLGSDKLLECGSYFAGMGSMEQALFLISETAQKNHLPFRYRMSVTCESQKACWPLLAHYADADTCLIPNILDNLSRVGQRACSSQAVSAAKKISRLGEAISQSKLQPWFAKTAACAFHNKRKGCKIPHPDLIGGGSECTDYSSIGGREGEEGKTLPPTLSFVAISACAREALHENVGSFPAVLEDCLSRTHRVFVFPTAPGHHGFRQIIKRRRTYRLIVRKTAKMVSLLYICANLVHCCFVLFLLRSKHMRTNLFLRGGRSPPVVPGGAATLQNCEPEVRD